MVQKCPFLCSMFRVKLVHPRVRYLGGRKKGKIISTLLLNDPCLIFVVMEVFGWCTAGAIYTQIRGGRKSKRAQEWSAANRQQHFDHHSIWANLGSNFMLIFNKYSSWIPTYLNCCILEKKGYRVNKVCPKLWRSVEQT